MAKLAEFKMEGDELEVTEDMLQAFEEEGYILVRGLLNGKELTKVKQVLEDSDLVPTHGYGIPDSSGRMPKMVLWRAAGSDVTGMICRCEKVVTTSEKLLGGEVYHYSSKLVMKEPLIGGRQEWHQDYGYWYQNGLLTPDALSVFMAVDKCTKANGCLQILPGSHKCGRIEHKMVSGQTGADLERVAEIRKKLPLTYVEMNAGDALFFHSNVLHMSDPNDSSDRRWALIMAYNRASNNPVERLAAPFPRYTPLAKVPNSAILSCTNVNDFTGKDFLNPLEDKTVKAETSKPGNLQKA
ncbi:L-proline trans-4-hydroxylase-like [Pecten maximus]|uniref:L-proline trans-4-hydroxylase-like n=1 Tax=Pecten maximus TaxID=6579 RepID=UPI0014580EB6|nr:L-proline trans-4-hydroxylase-like [Pecten maximus]XP_033731058.1 L-proline trans-4-hydroxylase-like [Pecten maximus]